MKRRHQTPQTLVSVRGIAELKVRANGAGLRLGAARTLTEIVEDADLRAHYRGAVAGRGAGRDAAPAQHGHARRQPVPRHALHLLQPELRVAQGDRLLPEEGRRDLLGRDREQALRGGVVDRHRAGADRARREGEARLRAGERELALADLYKNDGIDYLTRRADEILTEIALPDATGWRSTYWKLRRRGSFDFPVLGVAAAVKLAPDGVVEEARIVLGAVASRPFLVEKAGALLRGQKLTDEVIAAAADAVASRAKPMDNTDLDLYWRKEVVDDFVGYALREVRGDDVRATRLKIARQAL